MQFLKLASLFSLAAVARAGTITFQSLDDVDRTVIFTANAGLEIIPNLAVPAGTNVTQEFPASWSGNGYAVPDGNDLYLPGMLIEVTFPAEDDGISYYDISAIVNDQDFVNVQQVYPAGVDPLNPPVENAVGGCPSAYDHCDDTYYLPDDPATKAYASTDLVCTLGVAPSGSKLRRGVRA